MEVRVDWVQCSTIIVADKEKDNPDKCAFDDDSDSTLKVLPLGLVGVWGWWSSEVLMEVHFECRRYRCGISSSDVQWSFSAELHSLAQPAIT